MRGPRRGAWSVVARWLAPRRGPTEHGRIDDEHALTQRAGLLLLKRATYTGVARSADGTTSELQIDVEGGTSARVLAPGCETVQGNRHSAAHVGILLGGW